VNLRDDEDFEILTLRDEDSKELELVSFPSELFPPFLSFDLESNLLQVLELPDQFTNLYQIVRERKETGERDIDLLSENSEMFGLDHSAKRFHPILSFVCIFSPLTDYILRFGAEVEFQARVQELPCDGQEAAIDETKSSGSAFFFIVERKREAVEDVGK